MSSTGYLSELDLLRGRVTDLSRELAERDRALREQSLRLDREGQDRREQSEVLRTLVEGTAAETGEEFFASLVTHLTTVLKVQYAIIGEAQGDRIKKIRTLAVSAGGTLADNFEYELAHTPCATALTQTFACFDRDVQATFPQFQHLADLGAESYCAVPLRTKGGAVIGLLVVMDTKPLQHVDNLQSLLEIFAPRVAVEFERRRAEQERALALADLHNVMETVPAIMFTLDIQGNMVKWNRRVGEVTGYSPEELLNKSALAFVPTEEQARTAAAIHRAFTEGYAELEGHLLTKDHHLIPYHWTGALLKNPHGEPIGITGIGRDVSDKKRAEEALRESEQRFGLAVEGSNDILWDAHRLPGEPWHAPQTLIWWSTRVRELLDLEESESFETLDQWASRLHPDDKGRVFGQLAAHVERRVPYDAEYRLRTNRGDYLWIRGRGQAMWDEQGEIRRMSGSCQDITERKRAEKALCESEERYRTVVDLSPNGVLVYSNGKKAYVNQAACAILGAASPEQLLNNPTFHFSHPDVCESIHASIAQILATGEPVRRVERKCQRLDGSVISVEVDAGRIMWNGEPAVQVIFADITERKRTEEALRASEERFHAAFRNAAVGMGLFDLTNRIVEANQAFSDITGYSEAELKNLTFLDITHPDDRPANRALQQNAVKRKRESFEVEKRYIRKNGEIVWVHVSVGAIHDAQGHVTHTIGLITDITGRKLTEEALRASEERFRAAYHNASVGMSICDLTGRLQEVNQALCEILGYSKQELLATKFQSLTHPDDLPGNLDRIHELMNGTVDRQVFEKRYIRKDGDTVWAQVGLSLIRDQDSTPLHLLAMVQDITERKQAEKALRVSEERFDLAVRGSNTGIWDWDLRTNKTYFSPLWKGMLGYEEHELQGEFFEWEERLHPDDRERSSATVRAYLEGTTPQYELEHRLRHKDGSYRWILARGVSLLDAEGKPYRMAGSHIDVTEQKQTQEALAQHERQLQTVLDALPVGVWFTDQSGKVLLANPAAKQIWSNIKQIGLQAPTNPSGWWETIGSPNELHRWALSRTLTTGVASLNETLELECLDGTKKTIRNSTVPVRDEAENILGAIVLNEDITTLRQAQEALKLTQFSVDRAVEGFFWISTDARILNVNDAACRMLEYTCDELAAMTLHDIDPSFPSESWSAHWEEVKQKGSLTFESKYWSKTGRVLDTEVTINYLQYDGKEYICAIIRDIGERRQAGEALRASEERYRALYDETPTMYFTLATDGTVRSVNRFGAEQLGYQVEELIGHSVLRVFYEEDKEAAAASMSECLATPETTRRWEFRKVRKDGSIIWVRETARAGQSSTGETVVLVTCEDVTERKRAEEALRLAKFSMDRAADAVYWIDPQAKILDVNEAASLMLGYSKEELCAMTVHDLNPDFQAAMWPEFWAETQRRGTMVVETAHRAKNGRLIPVEVSVNYLSYEGKEYHCAFVRDITERKRAEEAFRRSEERFRTMFTQAPVGMALIDSLTGEIHEANSTFAQIAGRTMEEICSLDWMNITHPDDVQADLDNMARLNAGEIAGFQMEKRYVRPDGTVAWINLIVAPIQVEGQAGPRHLAMIEDITERMQLAKREASRVRQLEKLYELSMTLSGDLSIVLEHTVRIIGELFKVPVVCLSEIVGQELYFKAVCINGQTFTDAGHCSLAITPCATVEETKDLRTFDRVMECFPQASFLRDHQAVSYCGFPALDNDGHVVAVTCLLDDKPHEFSKEEQDILRIFGQRIATEIERGRHVAEQKRAADELQRSHAFIRQIIDTNPNFIFAKDRDGRFTLVNKAVADAYGTTVEHLTGKTDADFNANQEEVEFFRQKDLEVMDSLHERFIPEEVITDSKGKTRWLQTVKRSILDGKGRTTMLLGVSTDITDRKRMEETLRQRERDLQAAIEERERISQDLHDGILQSLFAVGLTLEVSKSLMAPRARKTSGAALNQAIDQLNRVMGEIRNFIAGLDSDLLQGKDLPMALKQMLESMAENQPTRVRLAVEDRAVKAVSAEQSLHLFRVIQEAVSNCIKHGRAPEARVSLKMLKQGVRLSIRDNGRGFNPDTVMGTGHGLGNMAARAKKIGGRFTVLSKVNEGTRIVLDLPKVTSDVRR